MKICLLSVKKVTVILSTGGFNLSTANNGNGGIAFTIAGHYALDDLDTPPFEIETIATATAQA